MKRYSVALVLLYYCFIISGCTQQATTVDRATANRLFSSWHDLSCQEFLQNYGAVCETVDTVLRLSSEMPDLSNRWYHGIAYFTRARSEIRLGKIEEAKADILLALDSGYRNDGIIRYDSLLVERLGKQWFDSVIDEWTILQAEKRKRWPQYPMTIFQPQDQRSNDLIVGLHGGNGCYEEFADHFLGLPDFLGCMMVFPAGPIRYSNVTYSWPASTEASDSIILKAIDSAATLANHPLSNIYLVGYSQGAATAIGYGLRHPGQIKGIILFSGFTSEPIADSLLTAAAKHRLPIIALSGTLDNATFLESMVKLQNRCSLAGILFQLEKRNAMPHEVPPDADAYVIAAMSRLRNLH